MNNTILFFFLLFFLLFFLFFLLFLGSTKSKVLILQNQQPKNVHYKLITLGLHNSMSTSMVEKNMKDIVPVGKQAHVRVSFEPKQEGAVVGNLIIHTIDGDFPIPIEGEATECIIRLEVHVIVHTFSFLLLVPC